MTSVERLFKIEKGGHLFSFFAEILVRLDSDTRQKRVHMFGPSSGEEVLIVAATHKAFAGVTSKVWIYRR